MRRLLAFAAGVVILWALYRQIGAARLWATLRESDLVWLAIALALLLPPTILTAWRLTALAPGGGAARLGEATRLTLAASTLNLVLPSKLGDIAKAGFMTGRGGLASAEALSLVVFEKAWDLLALLAWCVLGLLLFPGRDRLYWTAGALVVAGLALGGLMVASARFARLVFAASRGRAPARRRLGALEEAWVRLVEGFYREPARAARVIGASLAIWLLHLVQIWAFSLALGASVPFLAAVALVPLAILAGLLPLTLAGLGTRDAALVYFLAPYTDAVTAAALGLLCTLRYLLPALAGLPFLGRYAGLARAVRHAHD